MDVSGTSSEAVLYDRSRGLFHPNANGFAVMACRLLTQYQGTSGTDCLHATSPVSDTVNGNPAADRPWLADVGQVLHIVLGGFGYNQPIIITEYSNPTPLGQVTSDAQGTVSLALTLPPSTAGVHTFEFAGQTPTGTMIRKTVRVDFPGRPSGETYGTYVCGFTQPSDSEYRTVSVAYGGLDVMSLPLDESGCVLVEVPLLRLPRGPFEMPITVTEDATGLSRTVSIRPVPNTFGIWALGSSPSAVNIAAADVTIEGMTHSGGGVTVSAARVHGDAVEYGTALSVGPSSSTFGAVAQVTSPQSPAVADIGDYRPAGPVAQARGDDYHEVPATACSNGTWSVAAAGVPSGVVYVPCAVEITKGGTIHATIAAEGSISVKAAKVAVEPTRATDPALVTGATGAAVTLLGADAHVSGAIVAASGQVSLAGARGLVRCGVLGETVSISGAKSRVSVDPGCA